MEKTWYAVATMLGMIIGAGVLGIPYAFAKSGLLYGLINLAVVGFFVTIINLQLGEVILRTNGKHQLTGYAEKYLGGWGKELMALSMVLGIYGAMIAYLIGSGETLASLFGGSPIFYTLVYFVVFSSFIYAGIKSISRTEAFFMFVKLALFLAVLVSIFAFIKIDSIVSRPFSLSTSFFPFGVVLFSLLGMASIPEAREVLEKDTKKFKRVVLLGSIIPIAVYAIFGAVFVMALGGNITEVATVALQNISAFSFIVGSFFAVFAMTTAYLANGLALQEMYNYDYKINRKIAFALTCIIPLALIFFGVKSFIKTIGVAGAFSGGLAAVLVTLMFYAAKKKGERLPEYKLKRNIILSAIAIAVFIAGMVFELISVL